MTKHTIVLALSLIATTASAQSTGTVQVRVVDSAGRPLDGTVTFRSGNASQQCRTVASRCSIVLAAGTWSADVTPTRESSAGAQSVAVSGGSVANVTFRTRPASTTPATATTATATTATATPATAMTMATATTTTATTPTIRTQTTATPRVGTNATTQTIRTAPRVTTVAPTTSSTPATAPGVTATAPVAAVTPLVAPTVAPRVVTTAMTATTTTTTPSARDLGRGNRVCAQGNVTDALGRPADATVTVTRDGATIGTVRSVAGRFSMFDLPPGRYALRAVSARDGSVVQQGLDLGADVARVVVRVR